jgi:RNase P protein component
MGDLGIALISSAVGAMLGGGLSWIVAARTTKMQISETRAEGQRQTKMDVERLVLERQESTTAELRSALSDALSDAAMERFISNAEERERSQRQLEKAIKDLQMKKYKTSAIELETLKMRYFNGIRQMAASPHKVSDRERRELRISIRDDANEILRDLEYVIAGRTREALAPPAGLSK